MRRLRKLVDRHSADSLHPLCPQCTSPAETATQWQRGEPRLLDGVWIVQGTPNLVAHCATCGHRWTVHVERPVQELSRRPGGPFVAASSLGYLTPVHLHLLEIAFDLGQNDTLQPNAWTAVQRYIESFGFFGGAGSLLDDLREMTVAVQAGIETGIYGYNDLDMTPKLEPTNASAVSEYVVTWRDEEGIVCDRGWLLERLNTLLATYGQSHDVTYAQQYEPLVEAGRRAVEAQSALAQPKPTPRCQVVVTGFVFVVTLAGVGWLLASLTANAPYAEFYLIVVALVVIGICWVLLLDALPPWLSKLICPRR